MDKKKPSITLRTDSDNQTITQSLRNFLFHNTTEIITNLKKKKVPLKDKLFRKHNTVIHTEPIDFNKFDSISINANSPNASMNIPHLIEENYTFYIDKLRTMYPNFKFNHYSKYFEQVRLIKNNKELNEKEYNLDNNNNSHWDYLNLDKSFLSDTKEYKIDASILEQKKEDVQLTTRSFDSKIEGIELEIEKVLRNSKVIEGYIHNNLHYKTEIDNLLSRITKKQQTKKSFKQHYLTNLSMLMLAMIRKRNKANVVALMKQINQVISSINKLKSNALNNTNSHVIYSNEDVLSNIKTNITFLRKTINLRVVNYLEREIQKFNEQSEIKHIDQFIQILTSVLYQCFLFSDTTESNSTNIGDSSQYDLNSTQTHTTNYYDKSKTIKFFYLILLPNKTQILNQILSIFSIVITDNYEIPMIIDKLKTIFLNEIILIYDKLKQILSNMNLITSLSKAYSILIENYSYLLELFNNNFAFTPKNFNDLTKYIKTETKNRLFPLLNTMIIEIISNGDVEQLLYTKDKVKEMSNDYLGSINISLDEYYSQYENDYIFQFFNMRIGRIKECISKEQWIQVQKFNSKYQNLIDILFIDFHEISKDELYSTPTLTSNEELDYLLIKGTKVIVMESSLIVIEFIFDTYKLLFYFYDKYSHTILLQLCKWITYYLNQTQEILINSQGTIHNKKVTEREFMLLNATIVILKHIFFSFITYYLRDNDTSINETINSVLKKINEIHISCIESMNDVSTQV